MCNYKILDLYYLLKEMKDFDSSKGEFEKLLNKINDLNSEI